jgi:MFS family permease
VRLLVAVEVGLGFTLGALDVGLPAFGARESTAAAGAALLSFYALGSVAGSVWYGRRRWRGPARGRWAMLVAALGVCFLPVAFAPSMPAMAVALAIAGLGWGPATVALFEVLDEVSPVGTAVETFMWVSSAGAVGAAVGPALAGVLVAGGGPQAALALSAGGAVCVSAVSISGARRLGWRSTAS